MAPKGALTEDEFLVACKLVAVAQAGRDVVAGAEAGDAPLPRFTGIARPTNGDNDDEDEEDDDDSDAATGGVKRLGLDADAVAYVVIVSLSLSLSLSFSRSLSIPISLFSLSLVNPFLHCCSYY